MTPTDAFEMGIVHRVSRYEVTGAAELVGRVQPGQPVRWKLVVIHVANMIHALHQRHAARGLPRESGRCVSGHRDARIG
ncbi:hypothetical protein [Mycobacterium sp. 1423905.2]|uniref:hypothetical protein n=1 Tax=Mycobacterium sp. 1423905.2 TaxID=1856859 RepID=UPI0012E9BC88|nr:hypothetical protein [Mycobacterium sp. 1423905.2]